MGSGIEVKGGVGDLVHCGLSNFLYLENPLPVRVGCNIILSHIRFMVNEQFSGEYKVNMARDGHPVSFPAS